MTYRDNLKKLPANLRPDEKFLSHGPEALEDCELLAVIIRTGTSGINSVELCQSIIDCDRNKDLRGICRMSVDELKSMKGIGKVKALQLKAVAELARRMSKKSAKERLCFNNPETIADYFMADLRFKENEEFILLSLDTKGNFLDQCTISKGSVNASIACPREVFIEAVKSKAVNIILLHNHPSGDAQPSKSDIQITKRIKEAGEIIGIYLLDHIIIGDNEYISFKEKKLL